MKAPSFAYAKPGSLQEALDLLERPNAKILAGGQSLIPALNMRLSAPELLVDITGLPGLSRVEAKNGALHIGALCTHSALEKSEEVRKHLPLLAQAVPHIAHRAIRNRGTIGGSLANDDPSADYPAAALASGATIVTNAREIAADDYFRGMFTTALEPGEIITEVRFPVPGRANYQKFLQPASRFALVGVFVASFADSVRVAVTGASEDGVFRWSEAEAALSDDFRPEAVAELAADPAGMIGDLHGSPEYRAHLIGVLTRRAVAAAA